MQDRPTTAASSADRPESVSGAVWHFRPRNASVEKGGRWSALFFTAALHLGALGMVLAGGAALSGEQVRAQVDTVEGRVQLRFVAATPSLSVEDAGGGAFRPEARHPEREDARQAPQAAKAPLAPPVMDLALAPVDMSRPMMSDEGMSAPVSMGMHVGAPDAGRDHGQGPLMGNHVGKATAEAAASVRSVAQGEAEDDWTRLVMRRLEKFRTYPAAARHHRVQGVVLVQATIGADGRVLGTRLRSSCGNADLDAEALQTFARAGKLPAPPPHLPNPVRVDLPVSFALKG